MNPLKPQHSPLLRDRLHASLGALLRYQRHNHPLNMTLLIVYVMAVTSLSLKSTVDFVPPVYNDKVAHCITYALFTLLAWRLTRPNPQYIASALLIFAYSGLIEFIQPFTGRMLSGWDMVANALGISLTYLAVYRVSYSKVS